MFGQAWAAFLSLALTIVLANLLPKETYGLYRYILSLAGVLNIFTLTGMNSAVSLATATGDDGSLKSAARYQIKWNTLMLFAFWSLSAYYFFNDNLTIAASLLVMGIFAPLTSAFNTYGAFLQGKKNFRLNNIFSVLSVGFYVGGMMLVAYFSGQVIALVAGYAITTFITTALFYFLTVRFYNPPAETKTDYLKFGKKLTVVGLIGPIVSQIDSIILNHFWGPTQLATYTLAMAVPSRATTFIKDWVNIAFPKLATRSSSDLDSFFYRRIGQGLLTGIACAALYAIIAPYFFTYLMPKYLEGILYSQLLAVSLIAAVPNRYISILLTTQKLSGLIFFNQTIQNIIKIILLAGFGIFGGIIGLVIAQVLSSFVSLMMNIITWENRNILQAFVTSFGDFSKRFYK